MKRIIIALFFISFAVCDFCSAKSLYTPQISAAINMYKHKNYTECLQVMHEAVQKDPSNVLAYYYIAISQARLGDTSKAEEAYQRVIDLNSSTQLTNYSKNGLECLHDSTKCRTEFNMDPSKKAMDKVNADMENKKIDTVKDIVNQKKNIQEVPAEYMRDFKDYSLPKNQIQNKSELPVPTKNEIADALDTLKRAGYQNYLPQPATMSSEMMQMVNALGTNNNNMNPMANFMPYMANSSDMAQPDPQLIQTMMMSSMMNGLTTDYSQR